VYIILVYSVVNSRQCAVSDISYLDRTVHGSMMSRTSCIYTDRSLC